MIRFTDEHHRCPVCKGFDRMPRGKGIRCAGFLSDDGRWAHCTREEKAANLQPNLNTAVATFAHLIGGPCNCGVTHAPAPPGGNGYSRPSRVGPFSAQRQQAEDDEASADVAPVATYTPLFDFPTEDMPDPLVKLIESESLRLGLPEGMIGLSALVAGGAAIGSSRTVYTDDREHPASLWGVIVAESGIGKTYSPALKPYREAAREVLRKYRDQLREYQDEKAATSPKERRLMSPPPALSLMLATDLTTEALAEALQHGPHGILIDVDELSGWAKGLDMYRPNSKGSVDRHRYCSMWSREGFTILRKKQEPISVELPTVSLIGGMQPSVLPSLNSENDGLAQRFLYTYHADFEEQKPSREKPDRAVLDLWANTIRGLLNLSGPRLLPMTDSALTAWQDGRDLRQDHQRNFGYHSLYRKFDSYSARLALDLTLFGNPNADYIDLHWVKVAWEMCLSYFGPHGRAALRSSQNARHDEPGIDWLKRRPGGSATRRQLIQYKVAGVKTTEEADDLIQRWMNLNLVNVREVRSKTGGRPVFVVELS